MQKDKIQIIFLREICSEKMKNVGKIVISVGKMSVF